MDKRIDTLLAKALLQDGLISPKSLKAAQDEARQSGEVLVSVLRRRELVPETKILSILSERLKLPLVNLREVAPDQEVIKKVPLRVASYYRFAPVKLEGRTLTMAVSYPLDITTVDAIKMQLGVDPSICLASESDVRESLEKSYGLAADTIEGIVSQTAEEGTAAVEESEEGVEDIEKLAGDASVIKLVNQVILEAYRKRATDIHIEPYRGKVRFRYRIDGTLYDANVPPDVKQFLMPILSRVKIMSNLNIVERRLPQDGRAIVRIQNEVLDLRVSTMPTPYGESVVIRILPTGMFFSLEKLGLRPPDLALIETFIEKPHGIIFVTGPTGSGKTTTLYACLSKVNTSKRKIITIEDPIEYEMEGITQIQTHAEIGLDFARGLRSMLRHDPDVMMVGEVRDLETAEIAIRVALTGHLVLSTLHTNDAVSGITRLVDTGVEPFLVASSVEGFIAQRLVRVLCSKCKREDKDVIPELKQRIASDLGLKSEKKVRVYRAQGCPTCYQTGYFGRTAIYEILVIDEEIRDMIMKKVSADEIKRVAVQKGMRTLRKDGWQKVVEGVTTPDEVMNVTPAEDSKARPLESRGGVSMQSIPVPREDERRAFRRVDSRVNVRYRAFGSLKELSERGQKATQFSSTKNIGAGGILFVSNEILEVGSILELVLELSGNEPLNCIAKIVRIAEIVPEQRYDVAVCFLDIATSERARLHNFVVEETG